MNALLMGADMLLGIVMVLVAWRTLASEDLLKAIALFIAFGLLMTLAWVRLDAVDVALAEAGIGAGFTGALLLVGLARLRRHDGHGDADGRGGQQR